ncbi:MAG TPA: carboxymuconolactone decarboxylase family protein [Fimbriimonadaceae bacterium]|nr:carboxymuconolactone decarboxylase family protein [Fimbriimonadaceae bacterium]
MRKKASETRLYRQEMNDRILNSGFKEFNRFFALDSNAYQEGAISVKNKELMGLVGSLVLRCNDCVFYHLDRCVTEGSTRQEILEALNIGLVIGGSIVIPHLRYAFEVLDELQAESSNN